METCEDLEELFRLRSVIWAQIGHIGTFCGTIMRIEVDVMNAPSAGEPDECSVDVSLQTDRSRHYTT